jgi:hypothetical protein
MNEIARITGLMQAVFEGDPYYGPSVLGVLNGVTAKQAASRRRWMAHSIWEIVAHLTAELRYATSVIDGSAGPWVEGVTTWPRIDDRSPEAWTRALEDLRRANRKLVEVVEQLEEEILVREPGIVRGPYYLVLHGTLQHNVFHAGELSMLTGGLGVRKPGTASGTQV